MSDLREALDSWKSFHRQLVDLLGLPVVERNVTLAAVRDLLARAGTGGWEGESWDIHRNFAAGEGCAVQPDTEEERYFLALALGGEVGEYQNLVKKDWRGDAARSEAGEEFDRADRRKEGLGDVAIQLNLSCRAEGWTIDEVAAHVMPKVRRRFGGGS